MRTCDTAIIVEPFSPDRTYCVYEHLAQFEAGAPPESIYIGLCDLSDVLMMSDARRNSEWINLLGNNPHVQVMIRIHATTSYKPDAQKLVSKLHMEKKPRCNIRGYNMRGISTPLICSNGQRYESQKDAALKLGLDAGSISRHLRGHLTHVGGYVFRYATRTSKFPSGVSRGNG